MLPTELEPREGGALTFHMGAGRRVRGNGSRRSSRNRRIEYEEDWATLVGHPGADVTPLATEFLVEARSGGTCVVRVVTSAFGTGADWEHEFWGEMRPAGRRCSTTCASTSRTSLASTRSRCGLRPHAQARPPRRPGPFATRSGIEGVSGEAFEARGLGGVVERSLERHFLLRVEQPMPGMLSFFSFESGEGTLVQLLGYVFGDAASGEDAAGYVAREQEAWSEWLVAATVGVSADSSAAQR